MKTLRNASLVALAVTAGVYLIHRLVAPLPDWAVRADGALMMVAVFTAVFSAVRLARAR